jgi:uncharacterized membrane protein
LISACIRVAYRIGMLPATEQIGVELKSCPDCDAQMPDSAGFCPGCGRSMQSQAPPREKVGTLGESLMGALAYLTFIPAVVFLLVDRNRRSPFVRFHSVQCLLFWLVSIAAAVLVRLFILLLLFVPAVGPLLVLLIVTIVALAALFIWIILVVKAFQGEMFALPLIGTLAEQYSGGA